MRYEIEVHWHRWANVEAMEHRKPIVSPFCTVQLPHAFGDGEANAQARFISNALNAEAAMSEIVVCTLYRIDETRTPVEPD